MFSWFRKKRITDSGAADEAEALEAEFNGVLNQVAHFSDAQRAQVARGVALSWKLFNAQFESADAFLGRPRKDQLDYLEKVANFEQSVTEEEPLLAIGVALTRMYLAPLIERNAVMVNRMAEKLEPLNRDGFAMLGSVLSAKPQEVAERELWSLIFHAATTIADNEEQTRRAFSPGECDEEMERLCKLRGLALPEKQWRTASVTILAIRGGAVVKELRERWRKGRERSFTDGDIQRASAFLEECVANFLKSRR